MIHQNHINMFAILLASKKLDNTVGMYMGGNQIKQYIKRLERELLIENLLLHHANTFKWKRCLRTRQNTWLLDPSGSFTDCSIKRFRVLVLKAISPASILTCSTRRSIWSDIVTPPYNSTSSTCNNFKRKCGDWPLK